MPFPARSRATPRHSRSLAGVLTAALLSGSLLLAAPAVADPDGLPDGRHVVHHTVRPGETATGLATRYHAWTDELIALNDLGAGATLYVGQRLRIPVVTARAGNGGGDRVPQPTDRSRVRRRIEHHAQRLGVDPELALAVAWQESGWQMDVLSSAGAIGAMQVLPDTGTWMSLYTGDRLRLRGLEDNVTAGVMLLRVLDGQTRTTRRQVAAYYQGLGAVRRHGLYEESKRYVASVTAIRERLERGRAPG